MGMRLKFIIAGVAALAGLAGLAVLLSGKTIAVLAPRGEIAARQLDLIIFAALLSMAVVIPVFILTIYIVVKYRDKPGRKARYKPNWDHSGALEFVWWGVPILLISILSVVTWRTSHTLDPYKPLASGKPMVIQVVALQWRWLFIYPEQNIATVNVVSVPVNQPVRFEITADAPMNAFWIPQLGSQIYAMAGMSTQLNLMADQAGTYSGVSSNISGTGFANMRFTINAGSTDDFNNWLDTAKQSNKRLSYATYSDLAKPSNDTNTIAYSSVDNDLYDTIVMKYMGHGGHSYVHNNMVEN